jgi:hypothetical protein
MGFKRNLAIFKYTMLRGYNWCQMPMLAVIGAGVIKPYFPNWSFYTLAITAFTIFFIVGMADKHFKILQEEGNYATETNPLLMKGLFEGKR